MRMEHIKIKYFTDKIEKLAYIDGKSDWIDLRAAADFVLKKGEFQLIPLGVAMELPEGYEAHVALQRESMAARYGLSEGEAEVLRYLLMGMKRDEIAEKMYLSPWTIKARTSAIYKKCGVHSYKELMVLVSGDEA